MNQRIARTLALVFALNVATGYAQPVGVDESEPSQISPFPAPPLPLPQPQPPAVTPPPEPHDVTVGPCDRSGCWATDGARYDRVGGDTLIGRDGRMCQYVGQGLPLACP